VRANVLTVFNGVLVTLFVLVVATGRWQNGLFAGVVVANAAIGIVQELRATRTLDRLAGAELAAGPRGARRRRAGRAGRRRRPRPPTARLEGSP
jgi:cation-transporting ATPase E